MALWVPDPASASYVLCLREAEFDATGAHVIRDDTGRIIRVRTGVDVPADIHGPCMVAIGAADPGTSSHG